MTGSGHWWPETCDLENELQQIWINLLFYLCLTTRLKHNGFAAYTMFNAGLILFLRFLKSVTKPQCASQTVKCIHVHSTNNIAISQSKPERRNNSLKSIKKACNELTALVSQFMVHRIHITYIQINKIVVCVCNVKKKTSFLLNGYKTVHGINKNWI